MDNILFSEIISLPTNFGSFSAFAVKEGEKEHFVLIKGEIANQDITLRIHSECLTGDVFTSKRCDCYDQLRAAMEQISNQNGMIIYLRQEGRGIGLFNKIQAYKLQEQGLDTVDANLELHLPIDNRDYQIAAEIIKKLNPKAITILTNNPDKIAQLKQFLNIEITQKQIQTTVNIHNKKYLETKLKRMKHNLEF